MKYELNEYKFKNLSKIGNFYRILHLIKTKFKEKFEILQACQTYPPGYCGAIVKKLSNFPLVVRAGGADIQKLPEINYGLRLNPIIEKKILYGLRNANAIVAISKSIRATLINLGISKNKIYLIPNGTNLERFNLNVEREFLAKYEIAPNKRIILAVGRYHRKKGFENLLYAIKEVKKETKDFICIILGRGNNVLMNLVNQLELNDIVLIIDKTQEKLNYNKIPPDEIISFYNSSDIYVSPSLIEGFQITNIEALAAGLPLIITDKSERTGWTSDYLINNRNGFRITPNKIDELRDKLLILLNDAKLRKSMGQESKRISNKFDWNEIAKKYMNLYEDILSNN